eukprot:PhM_4_TR3820/c1_g1_i1/m.61688
MEARTRAAVANVCTLGAATRLHRDALQYNPSVNGPFVHTPATDSSAPSRDLIIILGWGGARPAQLQRYVDLYLAEGLTVIVAITPLETYLRGQQVSFTQRVYDTIKHFVENNKKAKAIVHLFSNNGVLGLTSLQRYNRDFFASLVCGVIIDSAPTTKMPAPAVFLVMDVIYRIAVPEIGSWTSVRSAWTSFWLRFMFAHQRRQPDAIRLDDIAQHARASLPLDRDVMFMYGPKDALIPHERVHALALQLRAKSRSDVTEVVFPDSGHCAHLKKYPEKYISAVRSMLLRQQMIPLVDDVALRRSKL